MTDAMLYSPANRDRRLQLRLSERRYLLIAGDVLCVLLAVLIALRVWAWVARDPFTWAEFIWPRAWWFVVLVGAWLLLAGANDFYELRTYTSRSRTFQKLILITLQLWFFYLAVFFLAPPLLLPRLFIIYYGVASLALIAIFHALQPLLFGWASQRRRVMIVGTDWSAMTMMSAIGRHAYYAYDLVGVIAEPDDVLTDLCDVPVLGTGKDIRRLLNEYRIAELIVTSTRDLSTETFQGVMDAYESGASIVPMPLLYERITGQVPVEHVSNNWAVVLPIEQNLGDAFYGFVKRGMDVVMGLMGLVVFLIVLPLLALLIRLDSPGGIFYWQERTGVNGRPFRIYKFRSMRQDAEAQTGAVFSQKGDARVTRLGRFMRKTRLDELPQVVNVLRGEMSVVGPRPERPEHVQRLTSKIPFYRTRLAIRPGLTGWAQVRYNYGSTDEDALVKLQYDLYYIRHCSLLLDLNILLRTVGKVLKMSGV
ncbi:MAG TPA: sugar transferase [Aggregatilineales bacterium]|nr:sugar transferase [Aggregatilineales bacterium]